ncbi:MAG: hypothetical protein GXP34_13385 [Actinobacteria bacterium]|nr:hypothetical protein [Actinomycetota bacterium]
MREKTNFWTVSDQDQVIATVRPTDGTPMALSADVPRAFGHALGWKHSG